MVRPVLRASAVFLGSLVEMDGAEIRALPGFRDRRAFPGSRASKALLASTGSRDATASSASLATKDSPAILYPADLEFPDQRVSVGNQEDLESRDTEARKATCTLAFIAESPVAPGRRDWTGCPGSVGRTAFQAFRASQVSPDPMVPRASLDMMAAPVLLANRARKVTWA
jgi:hypothetical protein